jgi:hypothetical protein
MKEVLFSSNGGLGIILQNENEADFIEPKEISLAGCRLIPDQLTDLNGMFLRPIRYAGVQKNPKPEGSVVMCFHTGDHRNLFGTESYYYCFYKISEDKIFTMYSPISGRDYNWINGQWN